MHQLYRYCLVAGLSTTLAAPLAAAPRHAVRLPAHSKSLPGRHSAPSSPLPTHPGWTLTFDDEFNEKALDTTKWTARDWSSDINNELEDYDPRNVWLQDGYLRLRSQQRARAGRQYTSGEVRSIGKFSQLYGRFEFRARLARTAGSWTAEYLIAENDHWPPEIDVEEYVGRQPDALHMTVHYADLNGRHGLWHTEDDSGLDRTQWHVYAVEWEPGVVRWYTDDVLKATSGADARISTVPMYLRINTAIGGWGGDVTGSVWPQFHDIDYVRVYRRDSFPPPVNAGADQEITWPNKSITLQGISCNPMGPHEASWEQLGGKDPVAFMRPDALHTAAALPGPGVYPLRLTVSDGDVEGHDDLTVYVNAQADARILPAADAYTFVNSLHPGLHAEGKSPDLQVGSRPSVEHSRDSLQAYLNFDISHAPKAAHAHLRLYGGQVYTMDSKTLPCVVSAVPAPQWDETAGNWSDAPVLGDKVASFDVRPFVHNSTERWYDIDVTAYVQAQQQAGKTQIGLALTPADTSIPITAIFRSHRDAAFAPHLIISP